MIVQDNKQYRNLEEQVLKNQSDINYLSNTAAVLGQYGIKVVLEANPVTSLPDPATEGMLCFMQSGDIYNWYIYSANHWYGPSEEQARIETFQAKYPNTEYGDTFAIKNSSDPLNYFLLTYTRANTTHAYDYFFNIGLFPTPGPKGPRGEPGQFQAGEGIQVVGQVIKIDADVVATRTYVNGKIDDVEDQIDDLGDELDTLEGTVTTLGQNLYTEVNDRTEADSILQNQINAIGSIGRFLSLWNAEEGVAVSNPATATYAYKTGDYFRVSHDGYRVPDGTSYVIGGTNYRTDTEETTEGDVWYFDGTTWVKQAASGGTGVEDVQVNGTSVVVSGVANVSVPTNNNQLTNGAGYITNYNGAVRHDMAQSLSTSAKTQARSNIGAGVPVEVEF